MNEWKNPISWSKMITYQYCPRQFRLQYVDDDAEEDEGEAQRDGIDFHEYMDRYYDEIGEEPDDRVAVDLAFEMFDPEQRAKFNQWLRNWHAWQEHLYDVWGKEHWKPLLTEERVEVEIDGAMHHAYIDRIQWDPKREEYGIIDYKPNASEKSNYKGQIAYYGDILLAATDLLDETPQWGGIYGYKDGKFKRWSIHGASTNASKRKIAELRALDDGFEPDFGMHCDYCGYQDECMRLEEEEMGLL